MIEFGFINAEEYISKRKDIKSDLSGSTATMILIKNNEVSFN